MGNSLSDGSPANRIKRSQKQEQKTAKAHKGQRVRGSGNRPNAKGDVRTKHTLIENKRTDHKQITLKDEVLRKNFIEAWVDNRQPVIDFELCGRDYVILGRDYYLELSGDDGYDETEDQARTPARSPRGSRGGGR